MSKKKKQRFWRSVIRIEVLSEGREPPLHDELTPFNIADEITTGGWSGQTAVVSQDELEPLEMAQALRAQGSEPEFLGLSDEGEILEED